MTNSGTGNTNSQQPTSQFPPQPARTVRSRWTLRKVCASLALAAMLVIGPNSPLAAGMGAGPATTYAASPRGNQGTPNRFNPHADATSTLHLPSYPASTVAGRAGAPQPIAHGGFQPSNLGHVALDAVTGAHFASADGKFQVDVPAGAVSAADVSAAGGTLSLQVAQIAPPSGSNAGGSGIVSFGTYLLQVVDAHGVLAKQGLRQPVTVRLDYGKAAGVDLQHAFVTLNGALPSNLTTATVATTTAAANPALAPAKAQAVSASGVALGKLSSQNTTLDATNHLLVATPLISNPSTSMTWNTTGPIAYFGKPDIFNADLSAGALSAGLSIDVPAGPRRSDSAHLALLQQRRGQREPQRAGRRRLGGRGLEPQHGGHQLGRARRHRRLCGQQHPATPMAAPRCMAPPPSGRTGRPATTQQAT